MLAKKIIDAYNLLEDELSKTIYEYKLKWYLEGGEDATNEFLYQYYDKSRILALEEYPADMQYAICGAGNYGKQTLRALRHAGYQVKCFLDNSKNKKAQQVEGVPVKTFVEFVNTPELYEKTVVIIDNMRLSQVFFKELIELGFLQKNIYVCNENVIRTSFGNIYFDFPHLKRHRDEVFLDAGSYDGQTAKEFMKWCGDEYKKIYVFEPMRDAFEMSLNRLKSYSDIEFCNCALSNETGTAKFSQMYAGMMGSRLGVEGDFVEEVKVDSIDNILKNECATFIKIDIEGAELAALQGAENTLKKFKPNLAISLYHKNEDLYDIPLWLKNAVPEYKFYIRHYSNKRWDMVLYCVTE